MFVWEREALLSSLRSDLFSLLYYPECSSDALYMLFLVCLQYRALELLHISVSKHLE